MTTWIIIAAILIVNIFILRMLHCIKECDKSIEKKISGWDRLAEEIACFRAYPKASISTEEAKEIEDSLKSNQN